MRGLKPVEAAYLAGIIDGEGYIGTSTPNSRRPNLRLVVESVDRELIEWCSRTTRVGTTAVWTRRIGNRKPAFCWRCFGANAMDVLKQCAPYMVIKRRQAEVAHSLICSWSTSEKQDFAEQLRGMHQAKGRKAA